MSSPSMNLPPVTLSHLSPSETYNSIKLPCGSIIGVSKSPTLPPRIALPGGLVLSPAADISAQDFQTLAAGPDQVEQFITLRYATHLRLPKDGETVEIVKKGDAISVGGIVMKADDKLGQIVKERGTSEVCNVLVYRRMSSNTEERGLSICPWPEGDGDAVVWIDVVGYCGVGSNRKELSRVMSEAVTRGIEAALNVEGDLEWGHYAVFGGGVVLTGVCPVGEDEKGEGESEWRKRVHEGLLLGMESPKLIRVMRVYGKDVGLLDGVKLRDVHVGIKGHGMGEGGVRVGIVMGSYLYCHYGQDGFDDVGWGCAYRSLQTILSWCALGGYVKYKGGILPGHGDIQRALVAVGDKEASLIGSKEWIGANEVCFALEELTGLKSKILHVRNGGEMEGVGGALVRHFEEGGGPVMVGGGVLAWTILGVARNEGTGRCRFLILDPHYCGGESLEVVQRKGWVAWKGAEVFRGDAFYNLCLPERPGGV